VLVFTKSLSTHVTVCHSMSPSGLLVLLTVIGFYDCSSQLQLRGKSVDEPLLKPDEKTFAWQIQGLTQEHQVPYQLVLTAKNPNSRGLPAGVRTNIIHTLSMDHQMRIRWLDDAACLEYMTQHFKEEYVNMFRQERRGSFKGDICRAAVLYREGGFYSDLDLELKIPFTQVIGKKTTFMSCFTADGAILNALIAAAPRTPVMRETLKELRKWYADEAPHNADPSKDEGTSEWMGPLTMLRGLKAAMGSECKDKIGSLMNVDSDPKLSCGKQEFMLYREAELNCDYDKPTEECSEARRDSPFMGVRFGLFEQPLSKRRVIGWPRFEGCLDWGCHSGGWDESG